MKVTLQYPKPDEVDSERYGSRYDARNHTASTLRRRVLRVPSHTEGVRCGSHRAGDDGRSRFSARKSTDGDFLRAGRRRGSLSERDRGVVFPIERFVARFSSTHVDTVVRRLVLVVEPKKNPRQRGFYLVDVKDQKWEFALV